MAWQEREEEWGNIQEVFRLLGHVSVLWARIDLQLVDIIANLMDVAPSKALVFLENQLPSKKVEYARRLMKIRSPEGEWQQRAEAAFRQISQKSDGLNDRRNRYIHDIYSFRGSNISHAKVGEVASKNEPNFKTVTKEQIEAWCDDAHAVLDELTWLTQAMVPWIFDQRDTR